MKSSLFLDVNVWLALTHDRHVHHSVAADWLAEYDLSTICPDNLEAHKLRPDPFLILLPIPSRFQLPTCRDGELTPNQTGGIHNPGTR